VRIIPAFDREIMNLNLNHLPVAESCRNAHAGTCLNCRHGLRSTQTRRTKYRPSSNLKSGIVPVTGAGHGAAMS
jgi:hypothetical protein